MDDPKKLDTVHQSPFITFCSNSKFTDEFSFSSVLVQCGLAIICSDKAIGLSLLSSNSNKSFGITDEK